MFSLSLFFVFTSSFGMKNELESFKKNPDIQDVLPHKIAVNQTTIIRQPVTLPVNPEVVIENQGSSPAEELRPFFSCFGCTTCFLATALAGVTGLTALCLVASTQG